MKKRQVLWLAVATISSAVLAAASRASADSGGNYSSSDAPTRDLGSGRSGNYINSTGSASQTEGGATGSSCESVNTFPNGTTLRNATATEGGNYSSSSDSTYHFGNGSSGEYTNSLTHNAGGATRISSGSENTFSNGTILRHAISYDSSGNYSSNTDNTYRFGAGSSGENTNSLSHNAGGTTSVSGGSVNTFANGTVLRGTSANDNNGNFSSTTDNTYHFGAKSSGEYANSFNHAASGATSFTNDTVNTFANGTTLRNFSGTESSGASYHLTENTFHWANGSEPTYLSGLDSQGHLFNSVQQGPTQSHDASAVGRGAAGGLANRTSPDVEIPSWRTAFLRRDDSGIGIPEQPSSPAISWFTADMPKNEGPLKVKFYSAYSDSK